MDRSAGNERGAISPHAESPTGSIEVPAEAAEALLGLGGRLDAPGPPSGPGSAEEEQAAGLRRNGTAFLRRSAALRPTSKAAARWILPPPRRLIAPLSFSRSRPDAPGGMAPAVSAKVGPQIFRGPQNENAAGAAGVPLPPAAPVPTPREPGPSTSVDAGVKSAIEPSAIALATPDVTPATYAQVTRRASSSAVAPPARTSPPLSHASPRTRDESRNLTHGVNDDSPTASVPVDPPLPASNVGHPPHPGPAHGRERPTALAPAHNDSGAAPAAPQLLQLAEEIQQLKRLLTNQQALTRQLQADVEAHKRSADAADRRAAEVSARNVEMEETLAAVLQRLDPPSTKLYEDDGDDAASEEEVDYSDMPALGPPDVPDPPPTTTTPPLAPAAPASAPSTSTRQYRTPALMTPAIEAWGDAALDADVKPPPTLVAAAGPSAAPLRVPAARTMLTLSGLPRASPPAARTAEATAAAPTVTVATLPSSPLSPSLLSPPPDYAPAAATTSSFFRDSLRAPKPSEAAVRLTPEAVHVRKDAQKWVRAMEDLRRHGNAGFSSTSVPFTTVLPDAAAEAFARYPEVKDEVEMRKLPTPDGSAPMTTELASAVFCGLHLHFTDLPAELRKIHPDILSFTADLQRGKPFNAGSHAFAPPRDSYIGDEQWRTAFDRWMDPVSKVVQLVRGRPALLAEVNQYRTAELVWYLLDRELIALLVEAAPSRDAPKPVDLLELDSRIWGCINSSAVRERAREHTRRRLLLQPTAVAAAVKADGGGSSRANAGAGGSRADRTSSASECFYGSDCTRRMCRYAHPRGRKGPSDTGARGGSKDGGSGGKGGGSKDAGGNNASHRSKGGGGRDRSRAPIDARDGTQQRGGNGGGSGSARGGKSGRGRGGSNADRRGGHRAHAVLASSEEGDKESSDDEDSNANRSRRVVLSATATGSERPRTSAPVAPCSVNGVAALALMDSGSNTRLVSLNFVQRADLESEIDASTCITWESAAGEGRSLGAVVMPVEHEGGSVPLRFHVARELPYDLILPYKFRSVAEARRTFWKQQELDAVQSRVGRSGTVTAVIGTAGSSNSAQQRARTSLYAALLATVTVAALSESDRRTRAEEAATQLAIRDFTDRFIAASCVAEDLPPATSWDRMRTGHFWPAGFNLPPVPELTPEAATTPFGAIMETPDVATCDLNVPPDTRPEELAALRAILCHHDSSLKPNNRGIDMTPVNLEQYLDYRAARPSSYYGKRITNVVKGQALDKWLATNGHPDNLLIEAVPDTTYTDQATKPQWLKQWGPFVAHPVIVPKPNSTAYRITVDFRQLNAVSTLDTRPLPLVVDSIEALGNASRRFTMDLWQGFYQIPVRDEDRDLLRFMAQGKLYRWRRLPMGVKNGPAYCQTMMEEVFKPLLDSNVVAIYLDDIMGGDTPTQHGQLGRSLSPPAQRLYEADPTSSRADPTSPGDRVGSDGIRASWRRMLLNLDVTLALSVERNLVWNINKCKFGYETIGWLGQSVTKYGRRIDAARLDGIKAMGFPEKREDLVSFVALASYFRDFVDHMADLLIPLDDLLVPSSPYTAAITSEHRDAFNAIKDAICSSTELVRLDWDHPFHLRTDASGVAVSAVLLTGPPDELRPYCFASRKLTAQERNWNVTEREGLAIRWAVEKFDDILWARPFHLHTDHMNLVNMWTSQTPKVQRWCEYLSQFRFMVAHIPGKQNVLADALSRVNPQGDAPTADAAHPVAAAVTRAQRARTQAASQPPSPLTASLPPAAHPSDPVAGVDTPPCRKYHPRAVSFAPPEVADGVTAAAPTPPQEPAPSSGVQSPAVISSSSVHADFARRVAEVQSRLPASTLASCGSVVCDGILLRTASPFADGDIAPVLIPSDNSLEAVALRLELMEHAHEKLMHGGGNRTLQRLRDAGFWWSSMAKDVRAYVRACVSCQAHKSGNATQPHGLMQHVEATRPLEIVQLDLQGRLPAAQTAASGDTVFFYFLTAIDVFSKYVVAIPIVDATAAATIDAVRSAFTHFGGMPQLVQVDNGSNFDSAAFRTFLDRHHVRHHFITPHQHKSQGAVERVHRTLLDMLRTALDGDVTSRWASLLPECVLSYNTARHNSTGIAPALLFRSVSPSTSLDRLLRREGAGTAVDPTAGSSAAAGSLSRTVSPHQAAQLSEDELRDSVVQRQRASTTRQAAQHDAGKSVPTFNVGDAVFVRLEQRTGDKLTRHWAGPRLVTGKINDNIYLVEAAPERGDGATIRVHAELLRRADISRVSDKADRAIAGRAPGTYIVEKVVQHRFVDNRPEFHIHWLGYDVHERSWEPFQGFDADGQPVGVGHTDIVRQYMDKHGIPVPEPLARPRRQRRAARGPIRS
jgi:transposase InsO family protein